MNSNNFAGDILAAKRTPSPKKAKKNDGARSPSPIKVKVTRSAFAKILDAKKKNAEAGNDQPAKL